MDALNSVMEMLPQLHGKTTPLGSTESGLPAIIDRSGRPAAIAWHDFFSGMLPNEHTRLAYDRAVRCFLGWPRVQNKSLHEITAGDVGDYLRELGGSLPKKKQHLSGLRRFFDLLVERHVCYINPAAVARTERLEVNEGKTPQITEKQTRQLLNAINTRTLVGMRDRAVIGVLMWTGVRAGSVAKLCRGHYYQAADQCVLRFDEKRRKSREIPVRYDLQRFMQEYLVAAGMLDAPKTSPFFPTSRGRAGRLTTRAMTGHDICRMVKRRMRRAGLAENLSPHSFRVAVATDLLEQGIPLADVQLLLGHADPRTTRLYDRRQRIVTRNIVERIRLGS